MSFAGGAKLGLLLLEVYALAYKVPCFYPYDLMLSWRQVWEKALGGHMAWLLARHERNWLFTLLLPTVEAATSIPSGMLLAQRMRARPLRAARAATVGASFGPLLEGGQLRLFSRVGHGTSVATQAIWVASGASLRPRLATGDIGGSRRALATCTCTDGGTSAYSFAVCAASNTSTFGTFEPPTSGRNVSNINFMLMSGQTACP